jgi:hypothetical protein
MNQGFWRLDLFFSPGGNIAMAISAELRDQSKKSRLLSNDELSFSGVKL